MMRRRRPLLRGAMVGGIGYMAGKSGAKHAAQESSQEQRVENREGSQPAAPAPAPVAASAGSSTIEQLKQLGELRDSGVLNAEEFEREKQKLLAGGGA